MRGWIDASFAAESLEAKARWFQALSDAERMDFLCEITELALTFNPDLPRKRDVTKTQGRVQVLTLE